MKKIIAILCLVMSIILIGCGENTNDIIEKAMDELKIPTEVSSDITLPQEITIEKKVVKVVWTSDSEALTSEGKVTRAENDITVNLKATLAYEQVEKTKEFRVVVLKEEITTLDILEEAYNKLNLKTTLSSTYVLPQEIEVGNNIIKLAYQSNSEVFSNNTIVMPEEQDETFSLNVTLSLNGEKSEKTANITIKSFNTIINEALEEQSIPECTNKNLELIKKIGDIEFAWSTSNKYVLTDDGIISFVEKDTRVTLTLICLLEDDYVTYLYSDVFEIIVQPYDATDRIEKAYDKITIPTNTQNNINLQTEFDYDVLGSWESSNTAVVSNSGFVTPQEENTKVTLTLTLKYENEERTYTFDVLITKIDMTGCDEYYGKHNLIDRAINLDESKMENLEYKDGKVVLKEKAMEGVYTSKVFKVRNFTTVVGSYSCITSTEATAELEIRVRVNGTWSKYFSYGKYGLGLVNVYYDDADSIAKLSTDEIFVLNDKEADAIQYRFTMRKTTTEANSPQLSLVALALNISNYVYPVDTTGLSSQYDIDVPKLYQHDVPSIGSVICSATTTTMLLKWKGFDFTDRGYTYEHEFMAKMVADTGHNNPTYGNWSYNMITAGAFGVDAYVARMYSWEEVKWHLNNVGPIGANVKGQFGSYNTNGHLVVIRGYEETATGTMVICNDPNIKGVYYKVTLDTFINCWKKIAYIVE